MEIISYVGSNTNSILRRKPFLKFFNLSNGTKARCRNTAGFSFVQFGSMQKSLTAAKSFSFPRIKIYPRKILRQLGKLLWLIPFAAVFAVVPPAVYKLI